MKIGLISDTHDKIQNTQKAIMFFNDKNVEVVIHAGDIVSPETVEVFDGMRLIGICYDVLCFICSSCSMITDERIHSYCRNANIVNGNNSVQQLMGELSFPVTDS